MADVFNSILVNRDTGILNKDACIVLHLPEKYFFPQ
jgi:hypothetical protein